MTEKKWFVTERAQREKLKKEQKKWDFIVGGFLLASSVIILAQQIFF